MELNFEQIRSVTLGAVYLEQVDGGIRFHRFGEVEEALYTKSGLYPKLFAPAGIRLEFETDATALEMTVNAYEITSRSYFRVDVLNNGQLLGGIQNFPEDMKNGQYPAGKYPLGVYSGSFPLGAGVKTVTVQLPWSIPCAVERLVLADATYIKPLPREKKALLYGDSITQGYDTLCPSQSYAVRLCDRLGLEGINKAIGGECYCPNLASVPCGFEPELILGAYGVNDWHRLTQPDFEDRCCRFWQALCRQYPEAKKFALTPIWFIPTREVKFGPFENVEKTIRKVVGEFPEVILIHGWDFVPHDPDYYGDGRLHPNAKGFDEYYRNLTNALKPYM